MSDQVTSSGVVGILTFTSNLIKSRINKGVTLMEMHGEFRKCDKHYDSPGTATDSGNVRGQKERYDVTSQCFYILE
jgi:hypothetical protein